MIRKGLMIRSKGCLYTYFFPRQFLGPTKKGCEAAKISPSCFSPPRNLSGWNSNGSWKCSHRCVAAYPWTETIVYTSCKPQVQFPSGIRTAKYSHPGGYSFPQSPSLLLLLLEGALLRWPDRPLVFSLDMHSNIAAPLPSIN